MAPFLDLVMGRVKSLVMKNCGRHCQFEFSSFGLYPGMA